MAFERRVHDTWNRHLDERFLIWKQCPQKSGRILRSPHQSTSLSQIHQNNGRHFNTIFVIFIIKYNTQYKSTKRHVSNYIQIMQNQAHKKAQRRVLSMPENLYNNT